MIILVLSLVAGICPVFAESGSSVNALKANLIELASDEAMSDLFDLKKSGVVTTDAGDVLMVLMSRYSYEDYEAAGSAQNGTLYAFYETFNKTHEELSDVALLLGIVHDDSGIYMIGKGFVFDIVKGIEHQMP